MALTAPSRVDAAAALRELVEARDAYAAAIGSQGLAFAVHWPLPPPRMEMVADASGRLYRAWCVAREVVDRC